MGSDVDIFSVILKRCHIDLTRNQLTQRYLAAFVLQFEVKLLVELGHRNLWSSAPEREEFTKVLEGG